MNGNEGPVMDRKGGTLMIRGNLNLGKFLKMTGVGGALVLTLNGCATGGASMGSMTPAQASQVADEDCIGVPAKERELGILAYRDAVRGAESLKESEQVGKMKFAKDRGVVIALRAQPGMSAPWLGRVASCHMALAAAGRDASSASAMDPLLVPGAAVRVDETATGFAVSVRVPNDEAASETLRRAHALLTGPSGPATAEVVSQ